MGNEPNIIHGFLTLNTVLHYDTTYLSDVMSTKNSTWHLINVHSLCQKKNHSHFSRSRGEARYKLVGANAPPKIYENNIFFSKILPYMYHL